MTGREAMIETIYRAYDARGKGDINGLMAAFHPDAVFELKGEKTELKSPAPCKDMQMCRQH
jgi:ketosteroid isomerase-like protein